MKTLKNLSYLSLFAVTANFVAITIFCARQTPNRQLFSGVIIGVLLILSLISLVAGLYFCWREKFRAFIPATICLIGLPISFIAARRLGGSIEHRLFQKNLPRYTEVVRLIEKGEFKTDSYLVELPPQYSDLALRTWRGTNSEGAIIVGFITGIGFPVKHSGFMYVSTGKIESDAETLRRWPYYSRINTNWFRIGD